MAGEQAAPLPGHAVTPRHVVAGPSIINYRTNAIYEIGRPLRAEGATRATWTSADPPSGWLAAMAVMILFSLVASVVGTVLLNLLLR
jgi:hypothetical protein